MVIDGLAPLLPVLLGCKMWGLLALDTPVAMTPPHDGLYPLLSFLP